MATTKSPFLIYQDFISPKICETIVNGLGFYQPDCDVDGNPLSMIRHNQTHEETIFERVQPLISQIFDHYKCDGEYRGTEQMQFEYIPEGAHTKPVCGNSQYLRSKWVRTKDRDLTAILFLSDFNDNPPFDHDYEAYGGKLEFPQHQFGFNPQRGTLIVFPSGPHFINATAPVIQGDLHQVRFHIAATLPYLYQPVNFPGDYRTWFNEINN